MMKSPESIAVSMTRRILMMILLGGSIHSKSIGAFAAASSTTPNLLMIGNKLTEANRLEVMVTALLQEDLTLGMNQIYAVQFRREASRWAEYADSSELRDTIAAEPWTWVIMQEQSEIPAFWGTYYEPTFTYSVASGRKINDWIQNSGAETILMMTWARRTLDEQYPELFPDFPTMMDKLEIGYKRYQEAMSTADRSVKVAPVGLAFKYIRDSYINQGIDPASNGTVFSNLYQEDGVHPAISGSYLAASVLYRTITGNKVSQRRWAPEGVNGSLRELLHKAADDTVDQYLKQNPTNRPTPPSGTTNNSYSPSDGKSSPTYSFLKRLTLLVLFFGGVILGSVAVSRLRSQRRERPWRTHSLGNDPYSDLQLAEQDVELTDIK